MKKIYASQVQIGIRLPCDIYNEKGVLLWAQGAEVKTEQQAQKLIKEGYRSDLQEWIPVKIGSRVGDVINDKETPVEIKKTFVYNTVLDALLEIQLPLNYIFDVFKTDSFFKEKQPLTAQIHAIIDVILDICEKHPDEALGTVHLYNQGKYSILAALHRTIIATLCCKAVKLSPSKTRSIACAAITSNASIVKLTETLIKQSKAMSQDQIVEYKNAPSNSLLYLTRCGVRDEVWLDSVYMHKEKLDGSGFPRGLKDNDISPGARILAIAEKYISYVLPKHSMHQAYDPATSLKRLFKRNSKALDTTIIADFIKQSGIIPPGTFVTLNDGGIGVVVTQGKEKTKPVISKVADKITNYYADFTLTTTLPFTEIISTPNNIPKRMFKLWAIYNTSKQQLTDQ